MQVVLKALSWTFLHSLWQGLLAALLAAVIISVTKKASAKLRYNLLGAVLLLFIAATFVTFQVTLANQQQQLSLLSPASSTNSSNTLLATTDAYTASAGPASLTANLSNWFNNNADILMLAWTIFFILNCLKLATGLATVRRLRYYKTYPVTNEWKTKLAGLQAKLNISQPVQLLQSALVKVPVVLGILRPIILLPVGLLANIPPEQAEAILLHELAHVRRKDYLVNLVQRFADAIFFFNPAFLWLSSLLRQEREACCDDMAVTNTGQKRNYVDALVSFQEYSLRHSSPVMAIRSKRHYLLNRVKRIITNENKRLDLFEKIALLAGVIIFSAFTMIKGNAVPKEEGLSLTAVTRLEKLNPITGRLPALENFLAAQNPLVKKEAKKPVERNTISADTVPVKKENNVTPVSSNDKKIKSVSSTMDTHDDIKIQVIKARGEDGSQYHVRKETGKPVKLTVNGKLIPGEELGNWSGFLNQLYSDADEQDSRARMENSQQEVETKLKTVTNDIEKIKEKMQQKKEEIGVDKEILKNREKLEEKKAREIENRIAIKRGALQRDRDDLEKKRAEVERINKNIRENKDKTGSPGSIIPQGKEEPRPTIRKTGSVDLFKKKSTDNDPVKLFKPKSKPDLLATKPVSLSEKKETPAKLLNDSKKVILFDVKASSGSVIHKSKLFTLKKEVKLKDHLGKVDHQFEVVNQSEWELKITAPQSSPSLPKQLESPSPPDPKKKSRKTSQL